jgi:hypothetical protein
MEAGRELKILKEIVLPSLAIFIVVFLGVGIGWKLATGKPSFQDQQGILTVGKSSLSGVIGIEDEKTFRDTAEGLLEKGGIDGEGTHHLVREGGPSQNVYLTSSVVDLSQFVGKKVRVWGETFAAQHAGWLMDVGRIKVIE